MAAPSDRPYIFTIWIVVAAMAFLFGALTLCLESITLTPGAASKILDTNTASGWMGASTVNFRTVYFSQTYTVVAFLLGAAAVLRIKSLI